MHANEVIESYIDDTVRLLPGRQRDDVAKELRSLLNEELQAQAESFGGPPDGSTALELVRSHGSPNEAAARYQQPWAIIDPIDSTSFLRASFIGAGAIVVLSALRQLQPEAPGTTSEVVLFWILVWLGILVVAFGIKSWSRQRWPKSAQWEPSDRYRVNRVGTALVIPVAACCVVLYAAPAQVLSLITGGRLETSWAAYTENCVRFRLPLYIGLLTGLLALLAFAAIQGRWTLVTRRISVGLNFALAGLVLWLAVEGNIFQSSTVDQLARNVLAIVAAVYVPSSVACEE
jgi:hypothetical protein